MLSVYYAQKNKHCKRVVLLSVPEYRRDSHWTFLLFRGVARFTAGSRTPVVQQITSYCTKPPTLLVCSRCRRFFFSYHLICASDNAARQPSQASGAACSHAQQSTVADGNSTRAGRSVGASPWSRGLVSPVVWVMLFFGVHSFQGPFCDFQSHICPYVPLLQTQIWTWKWWVVVNSAAQKYKKWCLPQTLYIYMCHIFKDESCRS